MLLLHAMSARVAAGGVGAWRLTRRGGSGAAGSRFLPPSPPRRLRARHKSASPTRRGGGGGAGVRVVAEQHGISLEDAARMFTERFSPSTSGVKLDLRDTACGRGLVATGAIAEGETLLAVPWNQAIHVYECITSWLCDEDGYDVSDDVRLALELLRVLRDGGDGEDDPRVSVWREYGPMLPTATGAAAFWSADNIRELQFDAVVEDTMSLRQRFTEQATRHSSSGDEGGGGDECGEDAAGKYSKEDVLWALSMVHSRSFSVPTPSGRARALVPFCDLFNHRPESPADARKTDEVLQRSLRGGGGGESGDASEPWRVIGLEQDEGVGCGGGAEATFEMRSIWRFEEGDEVFITYGHETGAELLTSYGFFPEPNAGDFVRIYEDVQDLLDDDRWVDDGSIGLMMEKESVMWSMLAVRRCEPIPFIRPTGECGAARKT